MVFEQIFVEREYRCLDRISAPKLVLDCGANAGYSSTYFLSNFPTAYVVAVEPDPDNFRVLEKNLLPYTGRYQVVQAAVWPHKEKLQFQRSSTGLGKEWGRSVERASSSSSDLIETVDIPRLIQLSCFERVSILKVDIEGAERELFSLDSNAWLDRVDNIVIELHNERCREAFFKVIDPERFDKSSCGELTVCLGRN